MRSASAIVHEVCGSPVVEGCAETPAGTRCWVCAGEAPRGMPREKWQGALFTSQNRVRLASSDWVCEPCVHVASRIAPVPGRPPAPGKKFGGNFRNYSHLWDETGYTNASKSEKPLILAFLRRRHSGPWFAAIADSGQKHVIAWTPVNPPGLGGRVLFDETQVVVPRTEEGWRIVDAMARLLTVGATKEEIARGVYGPGAWLRCEAEIRSFEAEHGRGRHGAWFGLALWLAQRDEEAVQARMAEEKANKKARDNDRGTKRRTAKPDGDGAVGVARRVPARRRKPAEALGADGGSDAGRVADDGKRRGVVHGDAPTPEASRSGQLTLFGD